MIKKYGILAIGLIATLLTSCSDIIDDITGNGNSIKVEVADSAGYAGSGTRATYSNIIHTEFEAGDAIGVYAYNTDGELVSSNVKFTMQSDGTWTSEGKVIYNPDYKYYGYFPYVSDAYTPATADNLDAKFADFITDKDNKFWKHDQSSKANYDASNLMVSLGAAHGDRTIKFTMEHKRGLAVISGAKNQWYYSTDANTLLPTSVTVVPVKTDSIGNFTYTDNTNSYFLTKPDTTTNIGGLNWKIDEGKYMVYTGFMLTGTPNSYEYSTSADGGKTWSNYSASKPSWLTVTPQLTEGSATNFSVTPAATKTTDIIVEGADPTLQAATTANNVDLSMRNNDGSTRSSRTTANCYLVHAPGTYRLPLVYGNAIKNGSGNPSAYHTTNMPFHIDNDYGGNYAGDMLNNFVNHKGDTIWTNHNDTDPWIKNHGITIDGAKLIWQDVKGLITSVGHDGNDFLTFTVSKDNIAEGNAVIAATAGGTVVWSWHIWVTKQTLSKDDLSEVQTDSSYTYKVAPINLGFAATTYQGSKCRVRAIGTKGLSVQFQLQQPNAQSDKTNTLTNTYYEWGRKDPFPSDRKIYDIDGNSVALAYVHLEKSNSQHPHVQTYIENPLTYYYTTNQEYYNIYDKDYINLWNVDHEYPYFMNFTAMGDPPFYVKGATTKSIYDPCPPGYCVPTEYLYQFIVKNNTLHDVGKSVQLTTATKDIYIPYSSTYTSYSQPVLNYGSLGSSGSYYSATLDWGNFDYFNQSFGPIAFDISKGSDALISTTTQMSVGRSIRPVAEE